MSEEKIFIEKFGKKYYCLRQRNTIPCQVPKYKTSDPLNGIINCTRKKRTLKKDRIVNPNQLEFEENGLYKSVDILENILSFKLSNIKQFKPPPNKRAYFDTRLHEFIRINELAVGILDEIQYSTDMINDLKMVQIIFNHNLSQLQCIEDEQKYILERMNKIQLSCMDRFLRFVSCPCCS
ncbi:uncharacterized protein LOC100570821 [Acyrthosiphon pisum]|uniref:Uncharacterized protein n=1 Tax=Acyrthosiphon pisum TaxID=7029 RepID=A0A8R2NLK9_ACYPI|nr:uncharacterized protein LOC100570821 [Acyrthosiphon pisum]|eukprot:XP_008185518.1 PREDICTED: uncharacterized protein LOC100570821 [Acyrthosiphon pisum]